MNALQTLLRVLDLLLIGSVTVDRLRQLKTDLEAMKAQDRDPTPEEWQALLNGITSDIQGIRDADDRLNPKGV